MIEQEIQENIQNNTQNNTQDNKDKQTNKIPINNLKDKDYFSGTVKIIRRAKPGPVIFLVTDGTGSVDAVIKDSNFREDDVVFIKGPVSIRAGKMQIELETIMPSNQNFDDILNKKSEVERKEFSIQSDRFEKMQEKFYEIAKRIRYAILNNEPILIRHHNDSDGINSGLAIEQACKLFMNKSGINPDYNLYRSPSKAPFYEVADVFKDITLAKRLTGYNQKKPLILVLDNGSTPEDVFAFKTLKSMGFEAIVIDHHNPVIIENGKTSVCPYLSHHLNPYIYGLDSKTSAGMLCYEVARFIDKDFNNPLMPAIAGISDRCDIPETDKYIANTNKTREELAKIGVAIDYLAYQMKFDPGKGLFEEVYTNTELVKMINEKVREGAQTQLQSTLPYLRVQEINGITLSWIDLEKYTLRFTYPTPGKVIGMIHDEVSLGRENAPVMSLGILSDMIIIRATKPILPVQEIMQTLQKELPEANVDGGGHEMAGTIKFVQAHGHNILEKIKEMLKQKNISHD
ncbi:MAG: DHH family phosphoesterase [Candidatus Woesearchaeota archaeon]